MAVIFNIKGGKVRIKDVVETQYNFNTQGNNKDNLELLLRELLEKMENLDILDNDEISNCKNLLSGYLDNKNISLEDVKNMLENIKKISDYVSLIPISLRNAIENFLDLYY